MERIELEINKLKNSSDKSLSSEINNLFKDVEEYLKEEEKEKYKNDTQSRKSFKKAVMCYFLFFLAGTIAVIIVVIYTSFYNNNHGLYPFTFIYFFFIFIIYMAVNSLYLEEQEASNKAFKTIIETKVKEYVYWNF